MQILRGSMGVSWTAVKSAKWNGRIRLNGTEAHTDVRVKPGDIVSVEWAEDRPVYPLRPFEIPLTIPYEDENLLAVDKPAGLASQSSRNHPDDSLENALYARSGCPGAFVYRPVNRLDKGTGGLMIIAKDPHSQHLMQKSLHTPDFRRRYLALTKGCPTEKEGVLNFPIGKAPGATVKREVNPEGKECVTRYRVLRAETGESLILLELETGRTHQIRVHLSHIGCPVRGDFLYGTEEPDTFPGCFALHSAGVVMRHPITGKEIRLTSLPEWAKDIEPSVLLMDFH